MPELHGQPIIKLQLSQWDILWLIESYMDDIDWNKMMYKDGISNDSLEIFRRSFSKYMTPHYLMVYKLNRRKNMIII